MKIFPYLVAALCLSQTEFTTLQAQTKDDTMSDTLKLQVGAEAPDFSLPDQNGKTIHLKELRGAPVVLYFYPKDFTPGCTKEACDFRDTYAPLREAGAVVLGVSPDSPASHGKFITEHGLPFTLLSDTTHQMMDVYGAWGLKKQYGREYEGVIRSTVLIAPDGKIARVWNSVKVDGHVAAVLEEVKKIAVRK